MLLSLFQSLTATAAHYILKSFRDGETALPDYPYMLDRGLLTWGNIIYRSGRACPTPVQDARVERGHATIIFTQWSDQTQSFARWSHSRGYIRVATAEHRWADSHIARCFGSDESQLRQSLEWRTSRCHDDESRGTWGCRHLFEFEWCYYYSRDSSQWVHHRDCPDISMEQGVGYTIYELSSEADWRWHRGNSSSGKIFSPDRAWRARRLRYEYYWDAYCVHEKSQHLQTIIVDWEQGSLQWGRVQWVCFTHNNQEILQLKRQSWQWIVYSGDIRRTSRLLEPNWLGKIPVFWRHRYQSACVEYQWSCHERHEYYGARWRLGRGQLRRPVHHSSLQRFSYHILVLADQYFSVAPISTYLRWHTKGAQHQLRRQWSIHIEHGNASIQHRGLEDRSQRHHHRCSVRRWWCCKLRVKRRQPW